VARSALHGNHYGGDMVFPESWNESDAGIRDTRFRWPGYPGNSTVPYILDPSVGQLHNFVRTDPSLELIFTPYDYNSIMHYGNNAFSKQPNQFPTMVAKNGQRLYEPYEKPGFDQFDVYMIRKLYQC
ncbi:metalloendopeptidase, partial [Nephila pilipes]